MKPFFVHDYLREHLLESRGILTEGAKHLPDLESLQETEWSSRFEKLMRNRLILGAIRYGQLNAPNKPKYNRIDSIRQRLGLFESTGNAEHLVDIANLCLCEFEEPIHPKFHWKPQDDGIHTERKQE